MNQEWKKGDSEAESLRWGQHLPVRALFFISSTFTMLKALLSTSAVTVGFLGLTASAQAFTVNTAPLTDADFNTLLSSGTFTELFVAESRAGNGQTNGDYEFSINQPIPAGGGFPGPFAGATGQRQWVSGQAVDFSLSYNAITGEIAYTVGGATLSAVTSGSANEIYLRTRAQGRSGTNFSAMTLQNLMLDAGQGFQSVADLSSSAAGTDSDVDYLIISGLAGSFTLTGQQILSWDGLLPNGSRLASQIKVGIGPETEDPESVPEPAALLGLLLAGSVGVKALRKG